MNRSKLAKIILASTILVSSFSLIGCTNNKVAEDTNNTKNKVEQDMTNTKDKVKDEVTDNKGNINNVTDKNNNNKEDFTEEESKFDKETVLKDLKAKGFDPKVTDTNANTKNNEKIFSVDKQIVKIKGGELSLYEYAKDAKANLNNDINSIENKGNMINGMKMTWNASPHFYSKGRVIVVYDGNSQEIMTSLNEILGNEVVK